MYSFLKNKTFLSFILCFSILTSVSGQAALPTTYQVTTDTAAYILLPDSNWQVMADPDGKLNLDQAINSTLFQSDNRKINYKNHVYWQRFQLVNHMMKELKIALPEASFRADLFTKINDGKWEHYTTGNGVPWSHRDGLKRIPAFTLSIPAGDTLAVYKRIYWNYVAAQPGEMQVVFSFTDKLIEHNYVKDESHEMNEIQDTFLLGMFILSMVINFYFFLVVREKEFLYFTLFLLMASIEALCSLNNVFLSEEPQMVMYLYIFANSLSSFMLIQLVSI